MRDYEYLFLHTVLYCIPYNCTHLSVTDIPLLRKSMMCPTKNWRCVILAVHKFKNLCNCAVRRPTVLSTVFCHATRF